MTGRKRQDKKERATDNIKESSGRNALIYSVGHLGTACMEYCTLLEVRSTI